MKTPTQPRSNTETVIEDARHLATPPAVDLTDLTKSFGPVKAVDNISVTIPTGQVVALLGPNGAGKTTTLDMVLALAKPTSGQVLLFGSPPRSVVDQGRVTAVTQTGGIQNRMTVYEHVRLMADLFGYPKQRASAILEQTGLESLSKRRLGVCSGGERQKVKFAMSLVSDPDLLILDEPTSGMDVTARREFWSLVHQQAEQGRTIIFATHYLEEADQFSDRVIILVHGRVVADGSTEQIRQMVSGVTVSCRFDSAEAATTAADAIRGLADTVTVQGTQLTIATHRSDDVIATMIRGRSNPHDLRVKDQGIEEVFISLTESRRS
jgi:ABC-2 type transport system ATP-binding protein